MWPGMLLQRRPRYLSQSRLERYTSASLGGIEGWDNRVSIV
jgi:hypothetical protein